MAGPILALYKYGWTPPRFVLPLFFIFSCQTKPNWVRPSQANQPKSNFQQLPKKKKKTKCALSFSNPQRHEPVCLFIGVWSFFYLNWFKIIRDFRFYFDKLWISKNYSMRRKYLSVFVTKGSKYLLYPCGMVTYVGCSIAFAHTHTDSVLQENKQNTFFTQTLKKKKKKRAISPFSLD